jgi:hypothetical protein
MQQTLQEEKAERFLPEEYGRAVAGIPEVRRLHGEGEPAAAREKAYETLGLMSGLLERLQERKGWVRTLQGHIRRDLEAAEELGAPSLAAEAFARANLLFLQGLDEFQGYKLAASEETLAQAREAAREAGRLAGGGREQEKERSQARMLEVMRLLEEASTLTIAYDDGTVVRPRPWSGEPWLPEGAQPGPEGPSSPPRAGQAAAPAGTDGGNPLEQAKSLWRQGAREWGLGGYGQAGGHFQEARRLAEACRAQAVDADQPVYAVRSRDSLWRIAGSLYGDPRLWPLIWRRNRRLIRHPDRIQPGWKLLIPPR